MHRRLHRSVTETRKSVATRPNASTSMGTGYRRSVLALLRQPRWAGFAVLTVAMCVLFWWLGTWQWGRHVDRTARNDAIETAIQEQPIPLTTAMPDPNTLSAESVYRAVEARGTYLPDLQLLQRNPLGRSGFDVITPLSLTSGGTVLVNRGWSASSATDTNSPAADVTAPTGQVEVTLRLREPQPPSGRTGPPGQIYDISPGQFPGELPAPVYAAYGELVDQEPEPDPALELAGPAETGIGVHLFYAIQWWLFIVIALVGFLVLVRREVPDTEPPGVPERADLHHPLN